MRHTTISRRTHEDEQGSTLVIVLVMMLAIGALITAHLTKVMAEVRKVQAKVDADRALAIAEGELERAKNIVNAAPYVGGENTALLAAAGSNPPFVPGTSVEVTQIGGVGSDWFMLRATGQFRRTEKMAQGLVKQRSPVSAFNFFVVDHPLGISGAPRGAIHSNESIDFYFPWGFYRDQLTAGNGFNFKAGATTENTRILGPWDDSAPKSDILNGITTADLMAKADTVKVTDDLIAEVEFKGKTTEIKLFKPSHTVKLLKTGIKSVFSHYKKKNYTVERPTYKTEWYQKKQTRYKTVTWNTNEKRAIYKYVKEPRTGTRDVYTNKTVHYVELVPVYDTRTVKKIKKTQVWVEDPPPSINDLEGGFAVGGKEPELGHWEWISKEVTEKETYIASYRKENRTKVVSEKTGTEKYTYYVNVKYFDHWQPYVKKHSKKVPDGYDLVWRSRQVFDKMKKVTKTSYTPVYTDEPYSYYEYVRIPESLVKTMSKPTTGVMYLDREIRSIKGTINGQVSLVTNSFAKITDSLTYVDDAGETRMLNGTDPKEKYQFNPNYTGDSVLGIVSRGDILYAKNGPKKLEINASLISIDGKVSYEGIQVSPDGTQVSVAKSSLGSTKDSIRRLGGIVARKRPVTTYVDASNKVLAGYEKGISFMDRNMILKAGGNVSPPFVFLMNQPTWTLRSRGKVFMPK